MDDNKKFIKNLKPSGQIYWVLLILFVGILFSIGAYLFRPTATKIQPLTPPPLVETLVVKKENQRITINAYGTLEPVRDMMLRSEVSGRVMWISDNLVKGGLVKKGDLLVQIDQRDHLYALSQAKAELEKAKLDLEEELGRQVVAKREWNELLPSVESHKLSESLALRKPHLKEKKEAVEGALSNVKKEELDLKRTQIHAPFDAIVLSENVEEGDVLANQLLGSDDEIARLAATDAFRVQVSIPIDQLKWISIPDISGDKGSPATIIQEFGKEKDIKKGRVINLLGDLDKSGRMARVLVEVQDPLNLKQGKADSQPLLIGSFVRVEIEGKLLENIFSIPIASLREGDTVWILTKDNQLEVRKVNVVYKGEDKAFIDQGLSEGEKVIVSNLSHPIPGMKLRTVANGKK